VTQVAADIVQVKEYVDFTSLSLYNVLDYTVTYY